MCCGSVAAPFKKCGTRCATEKERHERGGKGRGSKASARPGTSARLRLTWGGVAGSHEAFAVEKGFEGVPSEQIRRKHIQQNAGHDGMHS